MGTGSSRRIDGQLVAPCALGESDCSLFAVIVLSPGAEGVLRCGRHGREEARGFSEAGASFVFQAVEPHQLVDVSGESVTFVGRISPPVKTFAFWILPTIIFFSSLMAMFTTSASCSGLSGSSRDLCSEQWAPAGQRASAAGNIFVGQTEAPLLIAPFVGKMTRSELNAVMTVASPQSRGAASMGFLQNIPGIAGHGRRIHHVGSGVAGHREGHRPRRWPPRHGATWSVDKVDRNVLEAAARGATEGAKLAINVAAMLIAFVGLIAMFDWMISWMIIAGEPLSLSRILGWVFSPIAFAMGVPWSEAGVVGGLLGEKLVLTELIAYIHLGEIVNSATPVLSERSAIIASYALCGLRRLHRHPTGRHRRHRSRADGRSRRLIHPCCHRRFACRLHDGHRRGRSARLATLSVGFIDQAIHEEQIDNLSDEAQAAREEPDDARYPLSGVEAVHAADPDQPREPEDVSSTGSQGWSHGVFASTRRTGV